jgi:hypothetical protein
MVKFDMGAAWDDATTLVKAHLPLTGILAGVFLFLPGMAVALLGPQPLTPPENATPEQALALLEASMWQQMPWLLAIAIISTLGSVAILRLWLARAGTSVGEALTFALMMIPTLVAMFLIQSFLLGIALLLLIVPAIYLMGRFAAVYPLLVDRDLKNPIAALQGSWQLTQGNGWRVALFIILFMVVLIVVSAIAGGVTSLFGAPGSVGHLIGSAINSAVSAGFGLLNTAVIASIYRQLTVRAASDVFQ